MPYLSLIYALSMPYLSLIYALCKLHLFHRDNTKEKKQARKKTEG